MFKKELVTIGYLLLGIGLFQSLRPGISVAQHRDRLRIMVSTGIGYLITPINFKNNWSPRFGLGVALEAPVLQRAFLQFHATYNVFALDSQGFITSRVEGGDIRLFNFMVNISYDVINVAELRFYLITGIGLFLLHKRGGSVGNGTTSIPIFSESLRDPAVMPGSGISWPLGSRAGVFGEIRYLNAFNRGPNYLVIPLNLGVFLRL